jgi:hypothetical protein
MISPRLLRHVQQHQSIDMTLHRAGNGIKENQDTLFKSPSSHMREHFSMTNLPIATRILQRANMESLSRTLPASWFCSPALYQLERRAVFLKVTAPRVPNAIS